ncbi:jg20423, partial [Pararge aegeria aegeria]
MWSGKKCSEGGAGTPSEEEIKVVLVGDTQCGKTSLVQRFVSDTFVEAIFLPYAYPGKKPSARHCTQTLKKHSCSSHKHFRVVGIEPTALTSRVVAHCAKVNPKSETAVKGYLVEEQKKM